MRADRKYLLATTVLAGLALMAPALARAQSPSAQPVQPAASANEVTEVVVTGSRIKRNEFNSASPIQVITSETATLEGLASTSEILQSSSLVAGSFQTNNQLTGFVVTGGPGTSTVSLRGLGASRTLVLVDGHRMGPAGAGGTVGAFDLNVLPSAIVDRVEILKDGASSIYGSDAVAGVINLITKKNIDGGVINASGRLTQHGGGASSDINGAWGKVYDRGFWNISGDYSNQEVLHRGQRPDTACSADYVFDPTTFARLDVVDSNGRPLCFNSGGSGYNKLTTSLFGDVIYPGAGVVYPTPGQGNSGGSNNAAGGFQSLPVPFGMVRQARAGFPGTYAYQHQTDPLQARQSIIGGTKLYTLNFRGGYDITPGTELSVGLLLNRRDSAQLQSRQFFPDISTSNPNEIFGNAFGAPASTTLRPVLPAKFDFDQSINYANAYIGLKGKFSSLPVIGGWDWELWGRASKSDATYGYDFIYNDRVSAISGASICNQALITISQNLPGGQCSTIPTGVHLFTPTGLAGHLPANEAAFLYGHEQGKTTYDEQEFEATTTGDLFSLPAGKVGAAFGVDYRHNSIDDLPGLNNRRGNLWGSAGAGHTAGSDSVKEVFGELEIPLIKGVPLVRSLDAQVSGRYTNYNSYGSNSTYKVGLDWKVNNWLRLRATRGTSFRAPALYELYLANQTGFNGQVGLDPCVQWGLSSNATLQKNCQTAGVTDPNYTAAGASGSLIVTGGGRGVLRAETSLADTLGVVFVPTFVDFSIAVDYTNLQVANEVTRFGAPNVANSCYSSASFPNSPFCTLVYRRGYNGVPLTGQFTLPNGTVVTGGNTVPNPVTGLPNPSIAAVQNNYVNVAHQVERAIDVTLRYRHDFDFGRLQIDSQLTWDLQNTTQLFANIPQPSYSGTTFAFKGPSFSGITQVRFEHGPWTGLWSMQMIGPGSDVDLLGSGGASTRYTTACRVNAAGGAFPVGTLAPCPVLIGNSPFAAFAVPTAVENRVEMTAYHTVSLRRTFDSWVIQGGVQNLFDERPPSVSNTEFRAGTAALNGYDMLGRRFFLNITKKF